MIWTLSSKWGVSGRILFRTWPPTFPAELHHFTVTSLTFSDSITFNQLGCLWTISRWSVPSAHTGERLAHTFIQWKKTFSTNQLAWHGLQCNIWIKIEMLLQLTLSQQCWDSLKKYIRMSCLLCAAALPAAELNGSRPEGSHAAGDLRREHWSQSQTGTRNQVRDLTREVFSHICQLLVTLPPLWLLYKHLDHI